MSDVRTASLFRNGRNQAIRIPAEFELPGSKVTIRKEGDTLIIAATASKKTLIQILDELEPVGLDDEFPDIDSDHRSLRDIDL